MRDCVTPGLRMSFQHSTIQGEVVGTESPIINDAGSDTEKGLSRRRFLGGAGTASATVLAGTLLEACGGSSSSGNAAKGSGPTSVPTGSRRQGGTLAIGFTGGGSGDTLDPDVPSDNITVARTQNLYNSLVSLDPAGRVQYDLAESITPNSKATEWTIRIRPDVTFHNGKALTADDVLFTLNRILDPKAPMAAASSFGPIDVKGMKKVDTLTIKLPYNKPYSTLVEQLATFWYAAGILPNGWDAKKDKPNGTGPFKYVSFTPGQQSVFVRNPNYWRHPAYLDKVVITDFADDSALINAFTTGQIQAAPSVPATDLSQVGNSSSYAVIKSRSGAFQPICMNCAVAPFNDVRVRQAFRLMVDRPQFIASGMAGAGFVGNDVFSPYDPLYDHSLQRHQDLAQAKSLLKAAGHENLTVGMVAAPVNQGTIQMAQVFAQQAQAAGIKVNLQQITTDKFFGPNFLHWNLFIDYWLYNPYFAQVAQTTLPTSPYNETHFTNSKYVSLYDQANATTDMNLQREIAYEMQKIDFNDGGNIIPAFMVVNDVFDSKLVGFQQSSIGESLGNFRLDLVSYKA